MSSTTGRSTGQLVEMAFSLAKTWPIWMLKPGKKWPVQMSLNRYFNPNGKIIKSHFVKDKKGAAAAAEASSRVCITAAVLVTIYIHWTSFAGVTKKRNKGCPIWCLDATTWNVTFLRCGAAAKWRKTIADAAAAAVSLARNFVDSKKWSLVWIIAVTASLFTSFLPVLLVSI